MDLRLTFQFCLIKRSLFAYSSSVLDLRLPRAYCDELANCAIAFIVEYPCLDRPVPVAVDVESPDAEPDDGVIDKLDKLLPF